LTAVTVNPALLHENICPERQGENQLKVKEPLILNFKVPPEEKNDGFFPNISHAV